MSSRLQTQLIVEQTLMAASGIVLSPLSQRTDALVSRIDQATESLLARFTAIAELSFYEEDLMTGRNASTAAATSLQIEDHAHQMIKASDDLRTIIREVKEAWIIGSKVEESQQEREEETLPAASDIDSLLRTTLVELGSKSQVPT